MKIGRVQKAAALILALGCASLTSAQTAYRWVDQDGKVHYGDRPPVPKDGREVQEKKLTAPAASKEPSYAMRQAMGNFPVILYVSVDCGAACKESRDYLGKRGIPFTEKLVATKDEIAALQKLLGGEAVAPVLQVGQKTSKGFLESGWAGLLDAAGYPKAP